ncbi:MAG TPA: SRPBCC family protein [Gemmatimonadaceae bacterium]|nr:SRPBCC family protein [Gemmatimonadaceae bacterium]
MQSEPVANEVATRRDTARTTREPAAPRNDLLSHLAAVGLGATAMYFLDPQRGRRRRHLMRDKFVHAAKEARGAVGSTSRDLQNRAGGLVAVARQLRRDRTDDEVLVERVRAALGRSVSHPGAIDVSAAQGRVTLRGQVLAGEADDLVASVARVRGTRDVVDDLERHELAGDVPALQGEGHLAESKFELMQENWTPAARLLAGVTGGAVAAMCLRSDQRRNALNAAMGLAGAALAVRSATNLPFDRLIGVGAGPRVVTVQKSINIAAPIDDVFTWLVAWERWPRWMSHVREVRSHGGSGTVGERTHWVVDGPAGTTVEWDAETTRFVPPSLVAWRTVEGSPVAHAGTIQLARTDADDTRLDVTISYNPIAGAAGHAIATLFRRDPKHQLEDDLARLKTTIETGRPPQDAAVRDGPRGAGHASSAATSM